MSAAPLPIDAVVTWVDGQDPLHRVKLQTHLATLGRHPASAAPTRFRSVGEIDWCITSLLRHAPFLRRIHIVTDGQVPAIIERAAHWPAALRNKLVVIDHRSVFAGHEDVLPTFNSLSIESVLFRVPGLAEHFVYLNDDFLLLRRVRSQDWFTEDGQPVLHGHWRPMPGRRWVDRVRALLRRVVGSTEPQRASYTMAQAIAARLAGFGDRFFVLDHQPHPMIRTLLADFHATHPQVLRANIAPRLRDATQHQAQSLSAHLALAAGRACIGPPHQLLYVKPASASARRLARQLRNATDDPRLLFACVQSLDQAGAAAQRQVAECLDRLVPPIRDEAMAGD